VLRAVQGVEIRPGADVASRLEALFECMQAGDVPGGDPGAQIGPQGLLALGTGRQGEDTDDTLTGRARLQAAVQMPLDRPLGGVREQVIAQLRVAERLRLAGQDANKVAVVDTACPIVVDGIDARQGDRPGRTDEGLDAIVEDV
jgi:hypothetical protein